MACIARRMSAGMGRRFSIYVRPHDLDLTYERNGGPAWPCRLLRVIPLGGLVRLDVALGDGTGVRVELSRDRYAELEPRIGESICTSRRGTSRSSMTRLSLRDRGSLHATAQPFGPDRMRPRGESRRVPFDRDWTRDHIAGGPQR